MEGSLHFKIDGLALYLEVNLPFLLCFTLSLRGIFQVQAPGGLIFGHLTERFLRYRFWGAYIWRGLFSEFYGIRNYEYTFDTESCTGSYRLKSHIQSESYHRRKTPTRNLA